MYNAAASAVAARYGAKGIAYAVVSACSSSAHAIGQAFCLQSLDLPLDRRTLPLVSMTAEFAYTRGQRQRRRFGLTGDPGYELRLYQS